MFTPEEKQFLVNLLTSLNIKVANQGIEETIKIVKAILAKLKNA